ncbi:RagB/SusD family nutrient uptake outer membrane protein [Sphingobacterium sp. PCS056]|uniref:RagB/SusD family nutrient uptake outer membrane protein n=1 Tax=Sphingobacterium sp. PCS056 TaxID=2931400 RepID=UPI002010A82F|nr:RagB/SusD family nutrient uptake outer membrane protein [Sphingobacterium sp. PCS056]UPZ38315.1 RagB/SusD family nutrient uptake outer membrane protein [Sphingobacterium sp. PCS056]
MKTYKIFIYIIAPSLFLSVSCNKFLEHQPDDRTELTSPVKVAELLANAYPHGNYIAFAEAMSDNAGDKGIKERLLPNSSPWNYIDQIDAESEDTPSFYWNACYKAIAAANYALEAIEKAGNTAEYSSSKGEALVARAYAHFMLVTFFAKPYDPATASSSPGIPYVILPQRTVEGDYNRGTVASVYEQIEKDLVEGIPLIQNNKYRIPKYHFTTQAAHAFATRFYLFKQDYQKVVDHANLVFPGSTVVNNLRDWNTTYTGLGYYELQALYTNSTEPANLLLQEAASYWGRSFASYNYGLSSDVRATVFNASNNPSRKALAMSTKVFGGTETVYNIPKFKEHFVKQTINATSGDGYNMVPLLTSEEVLFNRAEANALLGNSTQAIADLDLYLSKRIVGYSSAVDKFTEAKAMAFFPTLSIKEALVGTVLNFKRMEYMHEGLRWLDILRNKIVVEHVNINGKDKIVLGADDPRRQIQIPQDAIAAGLEANPR